VVSWSRYSETCQHAFHSECIQDKCPSCRTNLIVKDRQHYITTNSIRKRQDVIPLRISWDVGNDIPFIRDDCLGRPLGGVDWSQLANTNYLGSVYYYYKYCQHRNNNNSTQRFISNLHVPRNLKTCVYQELHCNPFHEWSMTNELPRHTTRMFGRIQVTGTPAWNNSRTSPSSWPISIAQYQHTTSGSKMN
jgi:hypothetical protein